MILSGALDETHKVGERTHFAVTFVMSKDEIKDEEDYNLNIVMSADQKEKLQVCFELF